MPRTLPILDLSSWREGNRASLAKIAAEVGAACRDVGFFYVANHSVDDRLIAAIVWELACEAYYRDPVVLATLERRTGFGAAQATVGWELERFAPELIASVAERPATYVEVPS